MIKGTTGMPACGMTLRDCSPPSSAAGSASTVQATLYQLEYLDAARMPGVEIIESGFTAADAAIYLRSLLAIGVSPVTVRGIV